MRPGSISSTSDQLRGNFTTLNVYATSATGISHTTNPYAPQSLQSQHIFQQSFQANTSQNKIQAESHDISEKEMNNITPDKNAHLAGAQALYREDLYQRCASST